MRYTFHGILFACLFASCQKTDPPPSVAFGMHYAKSGTTPPSAIRVFTTSGEVKDASKVERINAMDSAYADYGAVNLARNPQGFMDTLVFETPSTAFIMAYAQKTPFTVATMSGNYVLTSKDTLTGYISGTEMSRNVQYFLPEPKRALYSESLTGVYRGVYTFSYRFRDRIMVKAGGGQDLDIPILLYSWYTSGQEQDADASGHPCLNRESRGHADILP